MTNSRQDVDDVKGYCMLFRIWLNISAMEAGFNSMIISFERLFTDSLRVAL